MPSAINMALSIGTQAAARAVSRVALAYATNAIAAELVPDSPGASDGQQSIQQPIPHRRRGYGRLKLGGYWTA